MITTQNCSLCNKEVKIDLKKDIKVEIPNAPIFYSCKDCIPYLAILIDFEEEKVQWH